MSPMSNSTARKAQDERDAAGMLADWIRDWRIGECEHFNPVLDREPCCAPCLRDRFLASRWLAARDRAAAERGARTALVAAADELAKLQNPKGWRKQARMFLRGPSGLLELAWYERWLRERARAALTPIDEERA